VLRKFLVCAFAQFGGKSIGDNWQCFGLVGSAYHSRADGLDRRLASSLRDGKRAHHYVSLVAVVVMMTVVVGVNSVPMIPVV
jgi:hypothetical protein